MANTRGEILVATESGSGVLDDGTTFEFRRGITRVHERHPAAKKWPEFFKPDDQVHYAVEDMTAEPGRKRGER
jgi:hypothetical protein